MENNLITLTAYNCNAKAITQRSNVLVSVDTGDGIVLTAVMHKKYFNQISVHGEVHGRLRETEDGLTIFEGFNFK